MFKYLISTVLIFSLTLVYGQPANDFCSGAQTITPDGSCYSGTIVAATDTWTGQVGCQSGNHVEVWYTFVATEEQLDINITAGTITGDIEFVLVESTTPPCGGLILAGSLCGPSPLTGTASTTLIPGATYYYTISSTGTEGTFTSCVTGINVPPTPGQDCTDSQPICDNSTLSIGLIQNGDGIIEENYGCIGNEQSSQWYAFTAGVGGSFGMMLQPVDWTPNNGGGDDYDFAFYDITSGCPTSASTPLACNYNFCPGSTGFSAGGPADFGQVGGTDYQDNNPPGPGTCVGGPQWETTAVNLTAGNTYAVFVQNYSTSTDGVDISFNGTAVMGQPADFNVSLDVTCMTATVDRTPYYTGTNSTYLWNFGDGTTSTAGNPGPHTYTSTGSYTISLTVTDAVGCVTNFSTTLDVGCILPIKLIEFNAEKNSLEGIDINWATATEINNDYFILESSRDGIHFKEIAQIKGAGNSTDIKRYFFKDLTNQTGDIYYRLKQVDFDGNFELSHIISVFVEPNISEISIVPNPVIKTSVLRFKSKINSVAYIRVLNSRGEVVNEFENDFYKGMNYLNIESDGLTPGMYFVTIQYDNETLVTKFIKK